MSERTDREFVDAVTKWRQDDYKEKYLILSAQHVREIEECEKLLKLIYDDLKMRSVDGVVDISNFIWERLEERLSR